MVTGRSNNRIHSPPRRITRQIREQKLKNMPMSQRVTDQLASPKVGILETIYVVETLFFSPQQLGGFFLQKTASFTNGVQLRIRGKDAEI